MILCLALFAFIVLEFMLFQVGFFKLKSASYAIIKKARANFDDSKASTFFLMEIRKFKFPSIMLYLLFLRNGKDLEAIYNNIAPTIENQIMHKENKELLLNEERIAKERKDAVFLETATALYIVCSRICNVQFFEEKNLVSKDQVREIISEMVNEESFKKIKGDEEYARKNIS